MAISYPIMANCSLPGHVVRPQHQKVGSEQISGLQDLLSPALQVLDREEVRIGIIRGQATHGHSETAPVEEAGGLDKVLHGRAGPGSEEVGGEGLVVLLDALGPARGARGPDDGLPVGQGEGGGGVGGGLQGLGVFQQLFVARKAIKYLLSYLSL